MLHSRVVVSTFPPSLISVLWYVSYSFATDSEKLCVLKFTGTVQKSDAAHPLWGRSLLSWLDLHLSLPFGYSPSLVLNPDSSLSLFLLAGPLPWLFEGNGVGGVAVEGHRQQMVYLGRGRGFGTFQAVVTIEVTTGQLEEESHS